jgi:hypothetical protein
MLLALKFGIWVASGEMAGHVHAVQTRTHMHLAAPSAVHGDTDCGAIGGFKS